MALAAAIRAIIRRAIVATAATSLAGWAALPLANAASESRAPCTADAMIVFDASGSMNASDFPEGAPNRIDRVRQALARFLPRVSQARDLGLVVYGPGKHANDCENVELKFAPQPNAGLRILREAQRLLPGGRTPLTNAVGVAAAALPHAGRGAIVLLTDGEETCGGDPCALAREIHAQWPNVVVHVIGYKLESLDGRPPVSGARCLAETTGGYSLTAETTDDLVRALEKTLGCDELSLKAKPSE
jgi:Ca-activated chloride channel homolog